MAYWDEASQQWLIDDYGRSRQATPEEIDEALSAGRHGDNG
jgi:hypothetical protein